MSAKVASRLKEAREAAGFATASEAARHFGWNENTYRSHENGERGLKSTIADKYAQAFNVPLMWLVAGGDPFQGEQLMSVAGAIGDGGIYISDAEMHAGSLTKLMLPVPVPSTCKIVFFGTDSLRPRYARHDILVFWGEPEADFSKARNFTREGIAWLPDGTGRFGDISHNGLNVTVHCIGSPPFTTESVVGVDVPKLILRSHAYQGLLVKGTH